MRFLIACTTGLEEVIGEPVVIEQCPDEVFAVHRSAIGEPSSMPYYRVSHVETGLAVGAGDSIDFAIRIARETFAEKTAEEIAKRLKKGRQHRKSMERGTLLAGEVNYLS